MKAFTETMRGLAEERLASGETAAAGGDIMGEVFRVVDTANRSFTDATRALLDGEQQPLCSPTSSASRWSSSSAA